MSNPRGLKESTFPPERPTTQKKLRCEALNIANFEHINISIIAVSVRYIKLWMDENRDLNIDHPLYCLNSFN